LPAVLAPLLRRPHERSTGVTSPDGLSRAKGYAHASLCYQLSVSDIMGRVKQLLLRVPEDVHRRLTARAAREGRSVNAVATQILDAAAEADRGDRRAQVRAAATAAGTLRAVSARPVSAARRRRITESTRGLGQQVDRLLAQERERP